MRAGLSHAESAGPASAPTAFCRVSFTENLQSWRFADRSLSLVRSAYRRQDLPCNRTAASRASRDVEFSEPEAVGALRVRERRNESPTVLKAG